MTATALPDHRWSWRTMTWPAYRRLLMSTDWPILVGPFYGEVGFEALYWQPFIEALKTACGASRIVPICRGGTAHWYGTPTGLELYAMRSPQTVRVQQKLIQAQTGLKKQQDVSPFDAHVLRDAAETLGLGRRHHVVHPAWMYHVLARFWTGQLSLSGLCRHVAYAPLPAPSLPGGVHLPPQFVAVRLYNRPTFPLQLAVTQQFAEATIGTIASHLPVIILDTPFIADDHADLPEGRHPNVQYLHEVCATTPETNLLVQSAIIARAEAFVGTYGGLAQLALRLGKPSVSFFLEWGGTSVQHHLLSTWLSVQRGVPYQVFRLMETMLTRAVLPIVEVKRKDAQAMSSVATPVIA